jgi:CheY-like chemotaxis protein/HPt (histidine-containing phosphotransfer) domain-containing protein
MPDTATTTPTAPATILVAEDSLSNQRLVALHLGRAGHRVDLVANGVAALEAIARFRYDLVLMDISMPDMDGLEATRRIRELEQGPHTPILALTGDGSEAQRQACLDAGMHGFLTKPVRRDTLLAAVARWTRASPAGSTADSLHLPVLLNETTLAELAQDVSPENLAELAGMLLAESETYVQEILQRADQQDWNTCARRAHALKSNAGAIGADRLRHLAMGLETAARSGDGDETTRQARHLARVALETRQVFDRHLAN